MSGVTEEAFRYGARQALEAFGLEARSLALVSISENVSFRVRTRREDLVLRLHRPGYNSLAELASERLWLAALRESGIRVQRALRTPAGDDFCAVQVPGEPSERLAGVTEWFPGEPLSVFLEAAAAPEARRDAFRQIGRLAASLHAQVSTWTPPPGFQRPRLDRHGLLGEAPRWGRFWEHPGLGEHQRDLLLRCRRLLMQRLQDYGEGPERFGLIHADLHAGNLIVHDGTLSLIDFDDAAYGWFVYDLATALIGCADDADYGAQRAALLAGYREVRALSPGDEAVLEDFIVLRGMAIIGWLYQRPEHAGSPSAIEDMARVLRTCEAFCARYG